MDICQTFKADVSVQIRLAEERATSPTALAQNSLVFLVSHHYQYLQAFYKKVNYFQHVQNITELASIGRSSFQYQQTNAVKDTGELLHKSRTQLVFVNKTTRRSIPLSESFVQRFQKTSMSSKAWPMMHFKLLTKPVAGAVQHTIQVQPSDADFYQHTNNAAYVKLCHDVGSLVAKDGKFIHLPDDLAFFRLKDVKCFYQGETVPGDEVDITVWESGERVVNFIAEKDNSPVFQCVMEFYRDEKPSSLL